MSRELYHAAQESLAKAFALDPASPLIKSEQGYFLAQFDENQKEGLKLLTAAEAAAPKDALIRTYLADVLSVPDNRRHVDLPKAIAELRTAIRLDPGYAHPHWLLARDAISDKQYDLAQEGIDGYLRLCPPDAVKYVKGFQDQIAAYKKKLKEKGIPPLRSGSH